MTRRTLTRTKCRLEHTCTRSVVASSDVFTSHSTWLKPFALVFHSHPIHGHAQRSLSVFLSIALYFLLYLFFLLFLMTDGDSVTMNTLCNSANGTFVTLDDYLSLTKSVRSSFGRTIRRKAIRESSIGTRLGKVPNWECFVVIREKGLFLSVYVDDIKLAGKKQNINLTWKNSHERR